MPGPQQVAMVAALDDDAHVVEQRARYAGAGVRCCARPSRRGRLPDRPLRGLALPLGHPRPGLLGHRRRLAELGILVAPGAFYGPAGEPPRPGRPHRHRRARRRGGRPTGVDGLRGRPRGGGPPPRRRPDIAGDGPGARTASCRSGRARAPAGRTASARRPGRPRGPTSPARGEHPARPGSRPGRPRAGRSARPGPTPPPSRPRGGTWHGNMNARRHERVEQARQWRSLLARGSQNPQ